MKLLIGFDVGGTKCAVLSGYEEDGRLHILRREAFPTPVNQMEAIDRMTALAAELAADAGEPIAAIGISAGSPMDADKGMLLNPPNLPGWTGISMTDIATERLAAPARMENDANACALAEYAFGAGRGARNAAFLTFGTGMGAGLILDGKMYRGARGNAGELGHWRISDAGPTGYGKIGAFEGWCSGGGMKQVAETVALRYRQIGKTPLYETCDVKTVAQAAREGDPAALEVFSICAEKLGATLALLNDLLDLDCIILGSIYPRCIDLLKDSVRAAFDREALPCPCQIIPAVLGDQIGDYAALSIAAGLTH